MEREKLLNLLTELENSLSKLNEGKENRQTLLELRKKAGELLKETNFLLEELLEKKLPEKLKNYFGKDYGEFLRSLKSEESFRKFLTAWLLKEENVEIPFKGLEGKGGRYRIELKEFFLDKKLREKLKEGEGE